MTGQAVPPNLVSGTAIGDLYAAIAQGRVRAVGWGAVANLRYFLFPWRLPLAYLIDSDPARWGTAFDGIPIESPDRLADEPPETVVVSFAHDTPSGAEIAAAIGGRGPFRILPPLRPWRDGPRLAAALRAGPVDSALADLLDVAAAPGLERVLDALPAPVAATPANPPIILSCGQMFNGGAERQLCYLATGLAAAGHSAEIVTLGQPQAPDLAAYLNASGVTVTVLPDPRADWQGRVLLPEEAAIPGLRRAVHRLPPELVHGMLGALRYFRATRPGRAVFYLDRMCIMGGLAALFAGVPRIVFSMRSLSPEATAHYWPFGTDWHRDAIRALAGRPEIRLAANSAAGALSYADWLGLDPAQVAVIRNAGPEYLVGWDVVERRQSLRRRLGIGDGGLVIAGVFRLAAEKAPGNFVEVVHRLAPEFPGLRAVLVGYGPLERAIRAQIDASGLADTIFFLPDLPGAEAIAGADLLLHGALVEGMPNVLLEAQFLGVPVVCFAAGGTVEALAADLQPYAVEPGDLAALTAAAQALLADRPRREALGRAAAAEIRRDYSLDRLVRATLALADQQSQR